MGKLTDVQINNWIASGKPVAKSDGDGLTFTMSAKQAVDKTGTWVLRYRISGMKSQKEIKIGSYPDTSLAAARKEATKLRARVQQGEDVAQEKRKDKQGRANAWTVRQLAADYLDKSKDRLAPSTLSQRKQQLRDHVFNKIGNLSVADVTPSDIVDITEASAEKSVHVARLVLCALRELFSHGISRRIIDTDPCSHVQGKAIIGTRPLNRTRLMLSEAELRSVFPALPSIGRSNELAIKILLSTCTRIGELTCAKWSHIDLVNREWVVPPELAKNNMRFVIPLTESVAGWFLELHALSFGSLFVFPLRKRHAGVEGDRHMEPVTLNQAINRLCRGLGTKCRRFTPHDLRSTARSHLSALGVDLLVAERCLNHSLGGLVAIYDQHDYLTERRKALELWSGFIHACETGKDWNVIPLKRGAA